MEINFVKYSLYYRDLSWNWLNDPEIKALTNTPSFTKEDQLNWYNKLTDIDNYQIWGVEVNGIPVGACGLKNITTTDCEYWGYIGEKEYWGKGIGSVIMSTLEERAMSLGLKSIWLKVLKNNRIAQKLYIKMGYLLENEDDLLFIMRKKL